MVEVRLMGDDPDRVRETAALISRILGASDEVVLGDQKQVPNKRGPGLRIFLEVIPARTDGRPAYVSAERTDQASSPARRANGRGPVPSRPRLALPPGSQ
ncbi:hypothetical protein [Sphaerisporangium aureirubrum]|uniref:Uncharacterized protein n=1 Tax=Sphaerisporangium aureirubrum TaxID=1544736 RepID=A0ABW1NC53_9ACTN